MSPIKTDKTLSEILRRNTQIMALMKSNNSKLDKLIKLKKEELDLLKSQKDILNIQELCAYTGLSKNYVYKLTATGVLPHSKPFGKLIFFRKKDIDDFMLKNPSTQPISFEEFLLKDGLRNALNN